ncbi:helix-turn-helix domain containing protein [Bacillus thuringiensis]|uniref:Helix-turn-helix domain containing protein n=1 Tax=Bacillus thuringiensis TaxID=1428 RepID=A0AAW9GRN6_BACTU|nr:helix-turn-helix domain containing protein [Bacillus thuringiensis]MDY0854739.1 helix-turn-helix domain containing protein [Bacillus thuringiensis]MDY4393621.1 helix-turn-helix domain containing protein [Bacillus thuringiensis]
MEKFIAELIQDTSAIRKINILEMLIESGEFISSKFMAKQLQCTNRTIINDISHLKTIIHTNLEIISVKSKGYFIKKNFPVNSSCIISYYLSKSEIYKILINIFKYKEYTLEKWSQLLYLNKLTLRKKLKMFENSIQNFRVSFNFRKLQLVGNELNVRCFYIYYFYIISKYTETIDLNSHLKQKINRISHRYKFEIDHNLLAIIINVLIHRITHKQYIPKEFKFEYELKKDKYNYINSLVLEIEHFYQINLSKHEKDFFILSFWLISEANINEKVSFYKLHSKDNIIIYNRTISLLKIISRKIKLDLNTKERIKYELFFINYKFYTLRKKIYRFHF